MIGSTRRTLALALLTMSVCGACASSQTGTAVDRLKRPAAVCAGALAGDDMPTAREDCLPLLAQLEAFGGW